MREIAEIKTDYICDNNLQHIDIFFTDDDMEQGNTAAVVCLDTNKVIYMDNRYRGIEEVDKAIAEVIESNKATMFLLIMRDKATREYVGSFGIYQTKEMAVEKMKNRGGNDYIYYTIEEYPIILETF